MIEVAGVYKRYGTIDALRNVSFTVQKGHVVGFLGANGAGKTTTMDILCGCIGADNGTVKISGFDITEDPKEAKKRLGYLPDEPPLHNDMKVEQFVTYAAELRGLKGAEAKQRVDQTIEKLSLGEVRHRLVGNLSKGFRQRVGLAQALVHNPETLVLDEPTEGLDPNQIAHIRDLIRSLKNEHTIILSSHILSEVQSICDEIIIIDKGQVVEQGPYEQLINRLEAGNQYHLRVGRAAGELLAQLQTLTGLTNLRIADETAHLIEFNASDRDDTIDQVARITLDGKFGLKELGRKSKSLEDVFFQLTKSQQ